MFVDDGHPSTSGAAAADATATRRPTATGSKEGGIREGETRSGGEWSPPPSAPPPAHSYSGTTTAPVEATTGEKSRSEGEDGRAAGDSSIGSWGYRSSLSSRGCWKVDAWAAARRDGSVELGFDSTAFDVFVRPAEEVGEQAAVAAAAAGKKGYSPAAVVTNVVPFRLADGLPRELGALLFDKKMVASLLSEDYYVDRRPPSRDGARRRREGKQAETTAEQQEGPDSSPGGETLEEEETGDALWVRKKASNSTGPFLSHVHKVDAAEGGKVEVRIRGEPLDAATLAMAGLPQDMAALVVAADVDTSTACASKRPGSASAGAPGGGTQGRRRQRAVAH